MRAISLCKIQDHVVCSETQAVTRIFNSRIFCLIDGDHAGGNPYPNGWQVRVAQEALRCHRPCFTVRPKWSGSNLFGSGFARMEAMTRTVHRNVYLATMSSDAYLVCLPGVGSGCGRIFTRAHQPNDPNRVPSPPGGRAAFKSFEGSNIPHPPAREGRTRSVRGGFFAWTRQKTLTGPDGPTLPEGEWRSRNTARSTT